MNKTILKSKNYVNSINWLSMYKELFTISVQAFGLFAFAKYCFLGIIPSYITVILYVYVLVRVLVLGFEYMNKKEHQNILNNIIFLIVLFACMGIIVMIFALSMTAFKLS